MRRHWALGAALLVLVPTAAAADPAGAGRTSRKAARPVALVWHAETLDGRLVTSERGDEPINPASVVKVATSLWGLERLGPEFRFETRFFARGTVDAARGILKGDLVVQGAGDPDFQVDNAFLVAEGLNRLGVRRVTGAVVVNRTFWIGFENGSAGMQPDATQRGLQMAQRLRQALDSQRWNAAVRESWRAFAQRRGLDPRRPFRVTVAGGVGIDGTRNLGSLLLVHRSEPLRDLLRRFNCFSNNDVERLGAILGPPEELAGLLSSRLDVPREQIQLETTSGLGVNRLSPRLIVGLMREFLATCWRLGVEPDHLLPAAGCDSGTVSRYYKLLSAGATAGAVFGKTGTLTTTDGGVSVLAGVARTASGPVLFCVAAPRSGGRLTSARRAEERWLLDFIDSLGGAEPSRCAGELPSSDTAASIIDVFQPAAQSARADVVAPTQPASELHRSN